MISKESPSGVFLSQRHSGRFLRNNLIFLVIFSFQGIFAWMKKALRPNWLNSYSSFKKNSVNYRKITGNIQNVRHASCIVAVLLLSHLPLRLINLFQTHCLAFWTPRGFQRDCSCVFARTCCTFWRSGKRWECPQESSGDTLCLKLETEIIRCLLLPFSQITSSTPLTLLSESIWGP